MPELHEVDEDWEKAEAVHDAVVQATFAIGVYRDELPDEESRNAFNALLKEAL